MSEIKDKIHEFQNKQLKVYQADPSRLRRDANSAKEVTKDHLGRLVLELIQNADDAEATVVRILLMENILYFADNVSGVDPSAVESLSGTHLSNKPVGTIGRKGLGFKSVYTFTDSPEVFTGSNDGILFCKKHAYDWLQSHSLGDSIDGVPYEWIPFWQSRKERDGIDSTLSTLASFSTVVRLPCRDTLDASTVISDIIDLPPECLITFRHLQSIELHSPSNSFFLSIERDPENPGMIFIGDSRRESIQHYREHRMTLRTPDDVLKIVDSDLRPLLCNVEVLAATGMDENGIAQTLDGDLPLFVYYPTEEPSPYEVVLHGDFIVSSDRLRIIDPEKQPFNCWLASSLAECFVSLVELSYSQSMPSSYMQLLYKNSDVDKPGIHDQLRQNAIERAKNSLMLPDIDGKLTLASADAEYLSTTVSTDLARRIISGCNADISLVHNSFDLDKKARAVLKNLGCKTIGDAEIIELILDKAKEQASNEDWIWLCWEWLTAWANKVADSSYQYRERKEQIDRIPILPVDSDLGCCSCSSEYVLAWFDPEVTRECPDWLPLHFIAPWFYERTKHDKSGGKIRSLLSSLGVYGSDGAAAMKEALGQAITSYWDNLEGPPERYIEFIKDYGVSDSGIASESIRRCPVAAKTDGAGETVWVEASSAYFGQDWGVDDMHALYSGTSGIAWVMRPEGDIDALLPVLEWLAVTSYPRIVSDDELLAAEVSRVRREERDYEVDEVPVRIFDRISIADLDQDQVIALLRLIVRHWDYYKQEIDVECKRSGPRGGGRMPSRYPSRWWHDVKNLKRIRLVDDSVNESPLNRCWLPDHEVNSMSELLPIIDLLSFCDMAHDVEEWLRHDIRCRAKLSELSVSEWQTIIGERIPEVISRHNSVESQLTNRIRTWYGHGLTALKEKGAAKGIISNQTLLCICDGEPKLVDSATTRWIADYPEAVDVAKAHLCLLPLRISEFDAAQSYMGANSLNEDTTTRSLLDVQLAQSNDDLADIMRHAMQYIYTWRCHTTKERPEDLKERLQKLTVKIVPKITMNLQIPGVVDTFTIERNHQNEGSSLYISKLCHPAVGLGEALAEYIGDKSESDYIENLLRCESDNDRRDKLMSRSVPANEIDHWVTEFNSDYLEEVAKSDISIKADPTITKPDESPPIKQPSTAVRTEPGDPSTSPITKPTPATESLPDGKDGDRSDNIDKDWEPETAIDDTGFGTVEEYLGAVDSTTITSHKDTQANLPSPSGNGTPSDPKPKLSDKALKEIGRWGEQWVAMRYLRDRYEREFEPAQITDTDSGFIITVEGEEILGVTWCNHDGERGNHYDILVTRPDGNIYIEVKTTSTPDSDWIEVSGPEWRFASEYAGSYYLYRVYNAGQYNPKLTIVHNPAKLWRDGKLGVVPVRLKL